MFKKFQKGRMSLFVFLALLVLGGLWQTSQAANVKINKSRDVHATVWGTNCGVRQGDPVFDGDVAAGDSVKVDRPTWATDTSTEQSFKDGCVASHSLGAIVSDSNDHFYMPLLNSWLTHNVGDRWVMFADLKSEEVDIYVAIDIAAWVAGGEPAYAWESTVIPITNGISPLLPGYQIGLSETFFDESAGWVNPDPYTGDVTIIGNIGMIPEPATLMLLGLGGLLLRRREKA